MNKVIDTNNRRGAKFFIRPIIPLHRQYEAVRAVLVEELPAAEAARRFGYSTATLYSLCRALRGGKLDFFRKTRPGPKHAPKREAAQARIVALRKLNYSVYDIQRALRAEGQKLSHVAISKVISDEGFAKLPRRRADERVEIPRPDSVETSDIRRLDWSSFSSFETDAGGLFLFLPTLVEWGFEKWISRAGLPGSQMVPAFSSFLSLMALKLTEKERRSHVGDVCSDMGYALFAGMNVIPKTTALSTYSYRVSPGMTASLLRSYCKSLVRTDLVRGESFNLDFHAIPQRGEEAVLEKHYITRRSHRERAILAFLVQDSDTRSLCYSNARIRKDDAAEEVLRFADFWKETHGKLPPHLVFDSQLTSYEVMDKIDKRGIDFITLRRRGTSLLAGLKEMPSSSWSTMRLDGVSRKFRDVRYVESTVSLRAIRSPLRQIAVAGLGHEEPTFFLTNDKVTKPKGIVERYAHRMLIENSIAENINFFHLDALSSSIAIQVDFDIMLTLMANSLYRNLAKNLTGFETAQPKQIYRRFLNTPARITVTKKEVRVRIRRCTHHPILLASGVLDAKVKIPWWGDRQLSLEIR